MFVLLKDCLSCLYYCSHCYTHIKKLPHRNSQDALTLGFNLLLQVLFDITSCNLERCVHFQNNFSKLLPVATPLYFFYALHLTQKQKSDNCKLAINSSPYLQLDLFHEGDTSTISPDYIF